MTSAASQPLSPASPDLIARVRKLLAMAEGTTNVNEADAFSRKAAELIAAHRIAPEQLRAGTTGELAVFEVVIGRGAYVRGRLSLLGAVARAQGCRVVFEQRTDGTVALVAGFRTDLDATDLLYHSLHTQAAGRMANERRGTPAATQQWRRAFLFGYAAEIDRMLTAAAQTAHVERAESHPSASALPALRARQRQVDEFARQRFGRVVTARRPRAAVATGWDAGRQAAASADLGRPRVGTQQRALGSGR
ncbi:MAG TPA: DUF2786 domain-containing protein [Ilumatobacter sp.]|nr:DUF2786 domain-containing protein [Ilumatobacter sp.]